MALYIPHSIFHLARLLCVSSETFGPYYVYLILCEEIQKIPAPVYYNSVFSYVHYTKAF